MSDNLDTDMIRRLIAAQLPGETCDALITILASRLTPREKQAVRDSYILDAARLVSDKKKFRRLIEKAPRTHRPDEAGKLIRIANRLGKPIGEKQLSRILKKDIPPVEMSV